METIRDKSRGEAVKEAQRSLQALGFSVGAPDGVFGIRTRGAVMAFQRLARLDADGVVGARTWAALARTDAPRAVAPPVPPDYKQFDARWGDVMYSRTGIASQTMANSGCGPTSASMMVESLCRRAYGPLDAARYALAHGYRTARDGTSWGYWRALACEFKLDEQQGADDALILAALQSGGLPVCSMSPGRWTSGGHYILPYRIEADGTVAIRDCGTSKDAKRFRAPFAALAAQCKQTFAFWPGR